MHPIQISSKFDLIKHFVTMYLWKVGDNDPRFFYSNDIDT